MKLDKSTPGVGKYMKKLKEIKYGNEEFKEIRKTTTRSNKDAWKRTDIERIRKRITGKSSKEIQDEFIDIEDWRD